RNDPGSTIRVRYVRDGRIRSTDVTLGYKEETKWKWVDADDIEKIKITERRAYMGVYLETNGHDNGVRITRVIGDAAADRAGLEDDDIILNMAGRETPNYNALVKVLRSLEPDQRVTVRVRRDGDVRNIGCRDRIECPVESCFKPRYAPDARLDVVGRPPFVDEQGPIASIGVGVDTGDLFDNRHR
ncbi:MAG: PDZ domain-containing protein, partial [bacterium]|nr:PDZ domain-containing protein [bacterium]